MSNSMQSVGTFGWWFTTGMAAPSVPSIDYVQALTTTSLRVYFLWAAAADRIYFERSTDGITYVPTTPAYLETGYYFDDTGLVAGTPYYYRIRAWNATGYSAYSTVDTGTTRISNEFERDLWSLFKTKMEADTFLDAYINTWKWNKEAIIISDSKKPLVKSWITDIQDEWIGIPKRKYFLMNIELHGIVEVKNVNDLETEKLKMSEYLKNALEVDLEFAGGSTINYVGFSPFRNLDDNTAEISVGVQLMSKVFKAGER